MKVGLFFGSFNPIHVGHMIIANHMLNYSDIDQLWIVVSPQNPFKKKNSLASGRERIHMVNLAFDDHYKIKSSDVEFALPTPSYTIDTLAYLKEKHPEKQFSLIMGSDNLKHFHKWKNYEQILEHYRLLIYRRPTYDASNWESYEKIEFFDAPLLDISSSYIRAQIKSGKSIQYLVSDPVYQYLDGSHLYQ